MVNEHAFMRVAIEKRFGHVFSCHASKTWRKGSTATLLEGWQLIRETATFFSATLQKRDHREKQGHFRSVGTEFHYGHAYKMWPYRSTLLARFKSVAKSFLKKKYPKDPAPNPVPNPIDVLSTRPQPLSSYPHRAHHIPWSLFHPCYPIRAHIPTVSSTTLAAPLASAPSPPRVLVAVTSILTVSVSANGFPRLLLGVGARRRQLFSTSLARDWYNLEKLKQVKAFRCGEYDECIEKAKASAANSNKKAVKYARREDASSGNGEEIIGLQYFQSRGMNDFLGLVEKFYYLSGRYDIELTVGDAVMENSFLRPLGHLELDLPEVPTIKAPRLPPLAIDPYTRYGPKAEITHLFRTPESKVAVEGRVQFDLLQVSFTGSMEVGREIMLATASSNLKQVSLELVGKSPLLIFDDADVDKAASLALLGIGEMNAIDSSLFKQWLHNLQSEIGILADGTLALRQVLILVPGIVFARGPAVTVLILLESDGETYAVLTEQARVPTGRIILELPAGMLDDDKGDFVGTAVQETGIKFKLEDMVDLTAFLDSSTGCRFFLSPTVDYKRPTYEEVENLQALLPREYNICQMQIGEMASIGTDNLNP
ncbi:Nudix hydrolase 14 [Arachis hypogaea]|nr:Nudix hydrolase 14 [Arachis hypogaea]